MKISLNHIRYYRDLYNWAGDLAPEGVDALVECIGAQLGAVEEVEDLGKKYQGIVVVKVVQCRKHEDSDHLNVCLIDDGGITPGVNRDENGLIQVVCGAPNVRAGLLVAWLPPGSTVPESVGKDPFVLETRTLRGVVSNGMLASARELALGDNHEGILELDEDVKPGDDFAQCFGLNDHVIDIENKMFTHRPDCFGMIGVAREIAGIQGQQFTSPDWYRADATLDQTPSATLPLEVRNELPHEVPRFVAVVMTHVTIKPSPVWLQINLSRLGVRPINNVVDLTNYYMLLTGQPMHAYDYDKVKALSGDVPTIVVRNPRESERITLLNGKTIDPRQEAIMIATDKQLIGVGGVMGGADTEVDETTKTIVLEVATFDMYSIRRTSMAHGLFTDAVTRFSKGQSPLQNCAIAVKAVADFQKFAGAELASELIDVNQVANREWVHPPVPITIEFINSRLGFDLSSDQIKTLLENVEFKVDTADEKLTVTAPFWRTDVETREDVVEEVGRLYGFDKLPLDLPARTIAPIQRNQELTVKQRIRAALAKAGANEVLAYSFVHGDLLKKTGQNPDEAFAIGNALSPDLEYYRLSLTPSLLEKVHPNIKAGYDQFALFEIGKVHGQSERDDEGLPKELGRVGLVVAAEPKTAKQLYGGAPYYEARQLAVTVLEAFGKTVDLRFAPLAEVDLSKHVLFSQLTASFEAARSALVYDGEKLLGIVGEYRRSVAKALKLPEFCAGFELFLSAFLAPGAQPYVALPRFPKVSQDISFKVAATVTYEQLYSVVSRELVTVRPEQTVTSLTPVDVYQSEQDADHKHITLRYSIASYLKTLQDQEVTAMLNTAAKVAQDQLGAERL